MEYRRFGTTVYARIDRGEEIVASILQLAEREKIGLAEIAGLGGLNAFTVGTFAAAKKNYTPHTFSGDYEMVSLTGTISTMNGAVYAHLHLSAADMTGRLVGGHLVRAEVGVTAEITLRIAEGRVGRKQNEAIGVNLWDFDVE